MSSSSDQAVTDSILLIVGAAGLVLLFFSAIMAIPLIAAGFGGWLGYQLILKSPAAKERQARALTNQAYETALSFERTVPDENAFTNSVLEALPELATATTRTDEILANVVRALYNDEFGSSQLAPPPAICNSIEGARYRDYLSHFCAQDEDVARLATTTLIAALRDFLNRLPALSAYHPPLGTYTVGSTLGEETGHAIESLVIPLFDNEGAVRRGIFDGLRKQIIDNQYRASGVPNTYENRDSPKLLLPSEHQHNDPVDAYLSGTPLIDLFSIEIPFVIKEEARFEHTWVLAPLGTGKTQLIQHLISRDLPQVMAGKANVMVWDSQGELINTVSSLKLFAPGEPLHGKLIVIRPDLEHPPALNLFDVGTERFAAYSPSDREQLTTVAIEQVTYILDALMGDTDTLTPKQATLYRYVIRLVMLLPGGNLQTFQTLLDITSAEELEPYQPYIAELPEAARDFFARQFLDQKEFGATKAQVSWRIASLNENALFEAMFSHESSRLDFFSELNEGKVILTHTDQNRLRPTGTNIFGRYFIAALLSACQERSTLERENRIPVFCYIDECQDYIEYDEKVARLLDQARKMKVGLLLAYQRLASIKSDNVKDALLGTGTKFVSTTNPNDLNKAAKAMRTAPEFIANQPERHFAVSVRREFDTALSFRVPFFTLENMEQMSEVEQEVVEEEMRATVEKSRLTQTPQRKVRPARKRPQAASYNRQRPGGDQFLITRI